MFPVSSCEKPPGVSLKGLEANSRGGHMGISVKGTQHLENASGVPLSVADEATWHML